GGARPAFAGAHARRLAPCLPDRGHGDFLRQWGTVACVAMPRACPVAIAKTAIGMAKRLAGWRMRRDTPLNARRSALGRDGSKVAPKCAPTRLTGDCLHVTNPTHLRLGAVLPRAAG